MFSRFARTIRRLLPAVILAPAVASTAALAGDPPTLSLDAASCQMNAQIVVEINASFLPTPVVGGQFFLEYDNTRLDFVSIDPGDAPFLLQVFEFPNEGAGTITYAVGVLAGGPGSAADTTMARITFNSLGDECTPVSDLVTFSTAGLPSRLTTDDGTAVDPELVDLIPLQLDATPPVIECPIDAMVACLSESMPADLGMATATDNCTVMPTIDFNDADNGGTGCPLDELIITRTWSATDACGNVTTCDQTITIIDDVDPVFDFVPADQSIDLAPGVCAATLSLVDLGGLATATDNCGGTPTVTFVRSDGQTDIDAPYDAADSPIVITWTATDACGNDVDAMTTITVDAVDELAVTVALDGVWAAGSGPLTIDRCITFELVACGDHPFGFSAELTFESADTGDPATATAVIDIPCALFECATAEDELHTLRRTDESFTVVGTQYVADFTGSNVLLSGSLTDDAFIDILDFGVYVDEFGTDYGTGDTTCATAAPHADLSGDGIVDLADFTFIALNFVQFDEPPCCAIAAASATNAPRRSRRGPTWRISLDGLRAADLDDLAVADLNDDGWLDHLDLILFIAGDRP